MFQTDLIIFLQSFANDFWTLLFKSFSQMGNADFVVMLVIVITVGIHFRKGLFLMQAAFWSGLLAKVLKEVFALPRPVNVDSAIRILDSDVVNPTVFQGQGAKSFFNGLPQQVIEYYRLHRIDAFGFPSGHTSLAVGFWGAMMLFFRKTWLYIIALIFLIGIPLSRLYLGRHFPADILAGYALGAGVIYFFWTIYDNTALKNYLLEKAFNLRPDIKGILIIIYLLLIPLLLLFIPLDSFEAKNSITLPAILLGINISYLLLWLRGLPREGGTVKQRILRSILALAFFLILRLVMKETSSRLFTIESDVIRFVRVSVTFILAFWGGTEVAIKLKLFVRQKINT